MPLNELYNPTFGHTAGASLSTSDPLQLTSPPPNGPAMFESVDLALDAELSRDVDLSSDFDW